MGSADALVVGVVIILVLSMMVFINVKLTTGTPATQPLFQCEPGECSTVIVTGEKSCPKTDKESIVYNPEFEVCNSKFVCENERTPYALQPDGSTDEFGRCPEGEICRCLQKPQCPISTMATFNASSSVFMEDTSSSRLVFYQSPISSQGDTGAPLTYTDPNIEFCSIKPYHLDRVSPSGCFFARASDPTLSEVSDCIQANPCIVGVMAFLPNDPESFILNPQSLGPITSVPVGCVPGLPEGQCGLNEVPVWDKFSETLLCVDIGEN